MIGDIALYRVLPPWTHGPRNAATQARIRVEVGRSLPGYYISRLQVDTSRPSRGKRGPRRFTTPLRCGNHHEYLRQGHPSAKEGAEGWRVRRQPPPKNETGKERTNGRGNADANVHNSITQHRYRTVSHSDPAEMDEAGGNEGEALTEHNSRSFPSSDGTPTLRREWHQLPSAQPTLK